MPRSRTSHLSSPHRLHRPAHRQHPHVRTAGFSDKTVLDRRFFFTYCVLGYSLPWPERETIDEEAGAGLHAGVHAPAAVLFTATSPCICLGERAARRARDVAWLAWPCDRPGESIESAPSGIVLAASSSSLSAATGSTYSLLSVYTGRSA